LGASRLAQQYRRRPSRQVSDLIAAISIRSNINFL
jgi:hypothetical protein